MSILRLWAQARHNARVNRAAGRHRQATLHQKIARALRALLSRQRG
jgi:hypothetical protein